MTLLRDDRALLDAFRRGEADAYARVFQHYVDKIDLLLRRGFPAQDGKSAKIPGLRDRDQVREMVHEVFVRAFADKARQSYDGLRPYQPYLLRIARNLLIDFWRKQNREFSFEGEDTDIDAWIERQAAAQAEPEDADERMHWRILREAAKSYINALSLREQAFVQLRFEQNMSQHEIVCKLGLTRWRVRRMESQIMQGLTRELKKRQLL